MDYISRLIFAGVPVQDAINNVIDYHMQGKNNELEKYVAQVEKGRKSIEQAVFFEDGK